jgi:acyl-coenzyme A thioesterase PaaI-like protein
VSRSPHVGVARRTGGGNVPPMALSHHDLCFGCGLANPFGLQLNLERRQDGSVDGRFFAKQDHQGAVGFVHDAIMAAALDEAAALAAAGPSPLIMARLEVDFRALAPIGTFVRVRAGIERRDHGRTLVVARAFGEAERGTPLAEGQAVLIEPAAAD